MNDINQNNVIDVEGGGGGHGEVGRAGSSAPADAASLAADAGSEDGGGAEWQMVIRGKARASGAKRTVVKLRTRIIGEKEGVPQTARTFEAIFTAERKRKAEDSVNDKLATMATAIAQLTTAQKQMAESQTS